MDRDDNNQRSRPHSNWTTDSIGLSTVDQETISLFAAIQSAYFDVSAVPVVDKLSCQWLSIASQYSSEYGDCISKLLIGLSGTRLTAKAEICRFIQSHADDEQLRSVFAPALVHLALIANIKDPSPSLLHFHELFTAPWEELWKSVDSPLANKLRDNYTFGIANMDAASEGFIFVESIISREEITELIAAIERKYASYESSVTP